MPEDRLADPTPCESYTVGDLLDHLNGAALAFRGAAEKQPLAGGPAGSAANLDDEWRTTIPRNLAALASAWARADAWTAMTAAGGVDLPGEIAGVVALDELVIHGWDLAAATNQPPGYEGPELQAVFDRVHQFRSSGIEGLFGPEVAVDEDAALLDRIVGLAGRDPRWDTAR